MLTEEQFQSLIEALKALGGEASIATSQAWGPSEMLAAAALAVSTIVAYSVFYLQRSNEEVQRKTDLTLTIFFQWDSFEMLGTRVEAERILTEPSFEGKSYQEIYNELRTKKRLNEWRNLSRIIHFCEMLSDLLRANRLETSLFKTVFVRDLTFWCEKLELLLLKSPMTSERANSIINLKQFLQSETSILLTTGSQPPGRC